jgi:hypothetical protein
LGRKGDDIINCLLKKTRNNYDNKEKITKERKRGDWKRSDRSGGTIMMDWSGGLIKIDW